MALSSIGTVLMGLASTKVVAGLYGPTGTATIGLIAGASATLGMLLGMGLDQAGTKRIAETRYTDPDRHASIIRTTFVMAGGLALIALVGTIAAAPSIARLLTGSTRFTGDVRIVSVAVALTIAAGAPAAFLHGRREITRLAVAGPVASAVGTILSVIALLLGLNLILSTLVVAQLIVTATILILARRAWTVARQPHARVIRSEARGLVALGSVFAVGSLATLVGALLVRVVITHRLGLSATGQFQAAFGVTSTAFSFMLQAFTVDYYPRLTQTGSDDAETNRVANHQLEFSLLLAAPIALLVIVSAPSAVRVLYSHAFGTAARLAPIFALSELIRASAWNLGFIMAAREAKKPFLLCQILNAVCPVATCVVLLPWLGITGSAISEVVTQTVMFAYVFVAARRLTGFRLSKSATMRLLGSVGIGLFAIVVRPTPVALPLQIAVFATVSSFCVRALCRDMGLHAVSAVLKRVGLRLAAR